VKGKRKGEEAFITYHPSWEDFLSAWYDSKRKKVIEGRTPLHPRQPRGGGEEKREEILHSSSPNKLSTTTLIIIKSIDQRKRG